jgi:ribosomal protein L11 methyltransferase
MRTWPAFDVALGRRDVGAAFRQPDAADTSDLLQAALTDYDVAAIDESVDDRWRIFFHSSAERDRAVAALATTFADLTFTSVDVPDEDWAARSQANLRAIRVRDIVVAPPWDASSPPPGVLQIVIQPSMGFGTGHHATTRLCLAALQHLDLRGRTVLDVGTGSGVLAIAASLRGAADVLAIDDDPDAVASAHENLALNPQARVTLDTLRIEDARLATFDVVIANLTGGLLIHVAERLVALVAGTGRLIVSGVMHSEEPQVLAAMRGARVVDRSQEDEWICATLQHEGAFA